MKTHLAFAAVAAAISAASSSHARVAVWNPGGETTHARFLLSEAYMRQVSNWLAEGGVENDLLDADAIADDARFNARAYDALIVQGAVAPKDNVAAYKKFLADGGVLVSLASPNLFESRVEPADAKGQWRLSPEEPRFAWNLPDIHDALGLDFRTDPAMVNHGVLHTPMAFLRDQFPAPNVARPVSARWFLPRDGVRFYPLIRSQMADGRDYTPQIFISVNTKNNARAVLCCSGFWTGAPEFDQVTNIGGQFRSMAFRPGGPGSEAAEWPFAKETVVALAKAAQTVRATGAEGFGEPLAGLPAGVATLPPLGFRALLPAPTAAMDGSLQTTLNPGESLRLNAVGNVMKIRAAIEPNSRAVLKIEAAGKTVWNERVIYRPAGERMAGAALEFNRLVLLPGADGETTITNPGESPLHIDGVTFQSLDAWLADAGRNRYEIGAHTSTALAYDQKNHGLTPDICREWSLLRCTTRMWWIGEPGDAAQWERFDNHVARYFALHPNTQFIIEGCPRWAAVSDDRWDLASNRPHMAVPDNEKYGALVERVVSKYAGQVKDWEIGNETTVHGFWNGTPGEYAEFFKAMEPVIRKHDPDARVIVAGMAGVTKDTIDPFILAMSKSGAVKNADLFGVHCYADNGAWDLPYGLAEGHLLALGETIEIFPNEQGAMIRGAVDEAAQGLWNSRGMARVLATGATKIIVFQSDGPLRGGGEPFGMLDEKGEPRPAYAPFLDYLELAKNNGQRIPVSVAGGDGRPVAGIHVAAARHGDGSTTIVVNPDDSDAFQPPARPETNLLSRAARGGWVRFFGKDEWIDHDQGVNPPASGVLAVNNAVVFTPDGERPMGFYYKAPALDPARHAIAFNLVNKGGKPWQFMLKHGDGAERVTVDLEATDKDGEFVYDLAKILGKTDILQNIELSFRAPGAVELKRFVLLENPDYAPPPPAPVTLDITFPLAGGSSATTQVTVTGARVVRKIPGEARQ